MTYSRTIFGSEDGPFHPRKDGLKSEEIRGSEESSHAWPVEEKKKLLNGNSKSNLKAERQSKEGVREKGFQQPKADFPEP